MPNYSEQISKIEGKLEQQRQRLRDLRAQETKQTRRDETRRKILYGAATLTMLEGLKDESRQAALRRIEQHVTRPKDREFLNLEPLDHTGGGASSMSDNRPAKPLNASAQRRSDRDIQLRQVGDRLINKRNN
ncbi:hypothetical protein GLP43_13165 [Sulfitobacter sp. M39]|uniref:hypothetical protein n=1 Tax=Sulfitobacter sp. M39 TaxID=2675334 RepID=UPI001F1EFDF5|nr:hypothetical protein [Sulfitobacter sp. M39]MCF7748508.1 hypothetical protein [Sulfitobacter sp. M39]